MLRSGFSVRHVATSGLFRWVTLRHRRCLVTLAIETSCDDTCVAVLEYDEKGAKAIHGEDGSSQARLLYHRKMTAPDTGRGGIVPVEAANHHRTRLVELVREALLVSFPVSDAANSHMESFKKRPDFVSVTRGPGMHTNLSCGLDTAKGLAAAFGVPLLGVHHMQAHALTPRLIHALQRSVKGQGESQPRPAFPFLTLLVSGGHTMLLHSRSLINHTILANTMDIAIGDCLDKCGRSILPDAIKRTLTDTAYGKHLSAYAFPDASTFSTYPVPVKRSDEIQRPVNKYPWQIQPPLNETRKLAFTYAGYVSHVDKILASRPKMPDAERLVLARTALGTAFEHLCSRTVMALESLRDQNIHLPTLVVSGGVAANDFLRYFLRRMLDARGFDKVELIFPPFKVAVPNGQQFDPCTDNAAMIAWAGTEMWLSGWRSQYGITAIQKWSMDPKADGGIAGAPGCYNEIQAFTPAWTNVGTGTRLDFEREQTKLNGKEGVAMSEQLQLLWKLKGRIDKEQAQSRQTQNDAIEDRPRAEAFA